MNCARCRRPLSRAPIVVDGRGFGPRCAALVGDLLTRPVPRIATRRPMRRRNDKQPGLFT